MPIIRIETEIDAAPERCFDLARDVDAHVASTASTRERAVAGVTTGLLGLGDEVTFEGVHFGIVQRLTARITRFDRPHSFVDEMVRGTFHSFTHEHVFISEGHGTRMIDVFAYRSPAGPVGALADILFLERYMTRLLRERASYLRAKLEGRPSLSG